MKVRFWIDLTHKAVGKVVESDGDILTIKYRGSFIEVHRSLVVAYL
jgi:hypothetical protein